MEKIVKKYFIIGNANEENKYFLETAVDFWSGLIRFGTREQAEEYINTTLAKQVEEFDRNDWEIAEVETIIKRGV